MRMGFIWTDSGNVLICCCPRVTAELSACHDGRAGNSSPRSEKVWSDAPPCHEGGEAHQIEQQRGVDGDQLQQQRAEDHTERRSRKERTLRPTVVGGGCLSRAGLIQSSKALPLDPDNEGASGKERRDGGHQSDDRVPRPGLWA